MRIGLSGRDADPRATSPAVRSTLTVRADITRPGTSVFLRDGDNVFHTYSACGRGTDLLNGTYNHLDLTPLGRQFHVLLGLGGLFGADWERRQVEQYLERHSDQRSGPDARA